MPRLVPEIPFPPYTYVPGVTPHPVSDPAGHSHGKPSAAPEPIDPARWWECKPYLHGLDLFNGPAPPLPARSSPALPPGSSGPGFGFYWEAHEVWEGLWHAAGRKGTTADFLKGLIKLAAAGVKHLEGTPQGVNSLSGRAADHWRGVRGSLGAEAPFLGFRLGELIALAEEVNETGWPTRPPFLLPSRVE
jgi:hypothetical protein